MRFCPSARSAASAHCAAKFSAGSSTMLAFAQFLATGAFAVTYVLVRQSFVHHAEAVLTQRKTRELFPSSAVPQTTHRIEGAIIAQQKPLQLGPSLSHLASNPTTMCVRSCDFSSSFNVCHIPSATFVSPAFNFSLICLGGRPW